MKKGFTLVELSIVLVIIGLLIGGILVAQSLIQTAKINGFIKQIQQYDVAVSNFQNLYKGLPGDVASVYSGADGNGFVSDGKSPPNDDEFTGEMANFWKSLSITGQLETQYTDVIGGSGIQYEVNMPQAKIGENSGIAAGYVADWPNHIHPFNHVYYIIDFSGNNGDYILDVANLSTSISAADALAVDLKIDDGFARRGVVNVTSVGEFGAEPTADCANGAGQNTYNVGTSVELPCGLSIIMQSQTGNATVIPNW